MSTVPLLYDSVCRRLAALAAFTTACRPCRPCSKLNGAYRIGAQRIDRWLTAKTTTMQPLWSAAMGSHARMRQRMPMVAILHQQKSCHSTSAIQLAQLLISRLCHTETKRAHLVCTPVGSTCHWMCVPPVQVRRPMALHGPLRRCSTHRRRRVCEQGGGLKPLVEGFLKAIRPRIDTPCRAPQAPPLSLMAPLRSMCDSPAKRSHVMAF